jgi:hypothetical protein
MDNKVYFDKERMVRLTDESVAKAAEFFGVATLDEVGFKLRDMKPSLDCEALKWWMFLVDDDPLLTPARMRQILDDFTRGGNWGWRRRTHKLEALRPLCEAALAEYVSRRIA